MSKFSDLEKELNKQADEANKRLAQTSKSDYIASLSTGTKPINTFVPTIQPGSPTTTAQAKVIQDAPVDTQFHADRLHRNFTDRQAALDTETQRVIQSPAYQAERAYNEAKKRREAANNAYNEWLAKSSSDEWLNAISAGEVSQAEIDAFNAQQKPLFDALQKAQTEYEKAVDEYNVISDRLRFFQKGAFENGVNPKTIAQAGGATLADAGLGLLKGIARVGEGLGDAASYGIADVAELFGNKDYADKVRRNASFDIVTAATQDADAYLDNYSIFGQSADALAEGVGQAGTIAAVSYLASSVGMGDKAVTALTSSMTFANSYGSAVGEAYRNGASDDQARLYGLIAATADAGTELLFAGLGKGGKAIGINKSGTGLDDLAAEKISKMFESKLAQRVAEVGVKGAFEGVEEVLAGGAQAWGKSVTWSEKDFSELVKDENLLEQFVIGMLTSDIVQMGDAIRISRAKSTATTQAAHNTNVGAVTDRPQVTDTQQTAIDPIQDPAAYLEAIVPKPAQAETAAPVDTSVQKKAVSEETTVTVNSGPPAITDKGRNDNTLAYRLATSIDQVRNMDPVSALTGRELNNRGKTITDQIADFFKSIGNKIFRNGLGDVELGEYGIASTINHKPVNRARIVSVAAAPDVIKSGRQIGYDPNWKGRGYPSYIFAAPVTVNGKEVYVAAVVDQRPNHKFYLSEMVDSEGNYVRIEESPSSNSKDGVTDGAKESGKAGITARPEGLSEGGYPSTASAEPTPLFDTSIRDPGQIVNPQESSNAQPSPSAGTPKQSLADYVASIMPKPPQTAQVDTDTQTDYNNTTTFQGGTSNANGLQQNDRAGSSGDPTQGLAGVRSSNGHEVVGRQEHGGVARRSGILRVSTQLRNAFSNRGTNTYDLYDTTASPQEYEQALTAGRNSDPVNGWCVTPKSAQELADGNVRTIMNADGTVGVGIAPDGDIVAVFKNKNGGPRRALDTAMPVAIEMGGDRLDCYGEGLVTVYEDYGFIPVARVEFNPEYANPGWPGTTQPYIYVMMHNGDNAATVAEKMHTYKQSTQVELDALPTYGKDDYDAAMSYRDNLIDQQKASANDSDATSSPTPSVGTSDGDGYGQNTVGSAESRFEHQVRQSNLYANTYANATNPAVQQMGQQAKDLDPNIDQYDVITEKESLYNASLRTSSPEAVEAEYTDLITKEHWSGEDLDTSMVILEKMLDQGDTERFQQLARKQRSVMTAGGQLIQAAAKYTRTNAASTMAERLDSLTPQTVNPNHFQKQGFEVWKKDVSATAFDLIKQVDSVKNGDTESIKQIIRSIARFRKTTAWFGASSNLTKAAERALNTLDFDTAKEIALRQISQIPGDFRKRSKGEVLKSIRIKNMLSSLLTIERNLGGNTAVGIMDGLSDSTVGMGLDILLSKVTGQRTVGFDIKYAPEYLKAAKEGAAKAALCAELDISMDTEGKYEGNNTRTHSPQGGPVTRFLSAYEKYLKYALEVTDKFYESGTYAAVEKSLQELGEKSNLQPEQIAAVSRKTANRRTFKDDGALATAAKGLRNAANSLTKSVSPDFGVGDMVLPFAGVGSNVTQTGIDYTAGTVKGAAEIFKLMADVKNGKAIDPGRQRKAVTDAARGVTGVGLISLFFALAAKGIIRAGDDEDKDRRALEQSSGLSGAQINIDAALRGLQGKSTQWQKDDVVFTVDFLEPFNTQMYLGYMLSQEDDLNLLNVTGATVQSIMASLMDSPMMQGLNEAVDLAENLTQAEDLGETAIAIGEYVGQTATSFIPGYVRQFAHTVDPIYRDTTGDNAADAAWNQAKAQIPWLSKTLPAKYGADGQPLRRYGESAEETFLGIRNNLLNPVTVTILDDPKLANALGDLSDRTGNVTIYPEKQAPKSFTVDGQTVLVSGKEMTETYQRTYMEHINDVYGTLLNNPVFDGLPDALKVKSLEYAKQYATEKAKASVSNFSLTSWVASAGDAPATAILDKVAVASTTDALTNVVNKWKNATEPTDADTAALDATWAIFQNMDKQHQATLINEQSGRVGAYLAARQAGMSTSVFVDLYKQYWSLDTNITLSDSARAKSWAVDLDHAVEDGRITQKQRNVLWDSLGYWTQIRQDTERYDNLVDSGLSATQSSDLLSTIAAIVPKPGKAQASDAQKFAAIIDFSGLTAKQEDAALREYMSDAQEEKYDQVLDMGLTAQDYLDAYNAIQEDSGTGKKKRVIAQFQSEFNMTHAQAKALYEIYVKPSK